jgi:hypothetical protein
MVTTLILQDAFGLPISEELNSLRMHAIKWGTQKPLLLLTELLIRRSFPGNHFGIGFVAVGDETLADPPADRHKC